MVVGYHQPCAKPFVQLVQLLMYDTCIYILVFHWKTESVLNAWTKHLSILLELQQKFYVVLTHIKLLCAFFAIQNVIIKFEKETNS